MTFCQIPNEPKPRRVTRPPRLDHLTTIGQYCNKIAISVLNIHDLLPIATKLILLSLEFTPKQCTATFELDS
jgi:hypothetical protein